MAWPDPKLRCDMSERLRARYRSRAGLALTPNRRSSAQTVVARPLHGPPLLLQRETIGLAVQPFMPALTESIGRDPPDAAVLRRAGVVGEVLGLATHRAIDTVADRQTAQGRVQLDRPSRYDLAQGLAFGFPFGGGNGARRAQNGTTRKYPHTHHSPSTLHFADAWEAFSNRKVSALWRYNLNRFKG